MNLVIEETTETQVIELDETDLRTASGIVDPAFSIAKTQYDAPSKKVRITWMKVLPP